MARESELIMAAVDAKGKLDAFMKLVQLKDASFLDRSEQRAIKGIEEDLKLTCEYWDKRLKRGK